MDKLLKTRKYKRSSATRMCNALNDPDVILTEDEKTCKKEQLICLRNELKDLNKDILD